MKNKSCQKFTIFIPALNKSIRGFKSDNLLTLLLKEGIFLTADCGGIGKCGKCKVAVLKEGIKFSSYACQIKIDSDLTVSIPDVSAFPVPKKEAKKRSGNYVIAIDIGSTTISGILIDLKSSKTILKYSTDNPLIPYGADILARAAKTIQNKNMGGYFKSLLANLLCNLIDNLAKGIKNNLLYVAIAGNTVMEHLFLGLNLKNVVKYPFIPLFKTLKTLSAGGIGLNLSKDCKFYIFPIISSFIGGDIVAAAFSVEENESFLLVDIGTNAEVILKDKGIFYAASSPAGPAFEGSEISCGVRNMPGAIDFVTFSNEKIALSTIGDKNPIGINGGGLFSIISLFLNYSVINKEGLFLNSSSIHPVFALRMFELNGEKAFCLYRDASKKIYITQTDIRKFQLAKGALKAVIELVAKGHNVDKIYITGNFGSSIKANILKNIGFFPENIKAKKITFLPDAVLNGCKKFLIDEDGIKKLERLRKKFKVIETSGSKEFENLFIKSLNF